MEHQGGFQPDTIALLGLGEAGKAIASGLCEPGGWRSRARNRQLIVVDTEFGKGVRGEAMVRFADSLDLPASDQYSDALTGAALVISVVTGEDAKAAADMARPWLSEKTLYADFNSITGPQTISVAEQLTPSSIEFVDVAVMGSFMATGHKTPLLVSGPRAIQMNAFAESIDIPSSVLSEKVGDASSVKILRSVLMKGIEALSVECLVAARRQGLVDHLLDNLGDVDAMGLAAFVRVLTVTHLTHAKRRMEEVDKAIQNLNETGVPSPMSEAIRLSHQRTVDAGLDPAITRNIDLDRALQILDEQVITR